MPVINMAHVAQQMFGTPLMVEPGKARVIAEAFGPRVLGQTVILPDAAADQLQHSNEKRAGSLLVEGLSDWAVENRKGYHKHNGVAVIEVVGSLVRRGAWIGQSSGMTSYEGLRAQIKAAAKDPDILAIALEYDTPGGEAAGAFELGDLLREVRAIKPVYAFCAEGAYSAGYAMASQASRITVPEFGGCGSIGVIMMHVEQSKRLEQEGLNVTIIRAGKRKAEGNSVETLPAELRDEWQAQCERMRVSFAELVGKGRGDRFDMKAALSSEARCFDGKEAVKLGLADQVADPKKAFDAMVDAVNETGSWDGSIPSEDAWIANSSSGCQTGAGTPQTPKETSMEDEVNEPGAKESTGSTKGTDQAPGAADTAERNAKIIRAVEKAGLPASLAADLVAKGATMEMASETILDQIAAKGADGGDIDNTSSVTITGDGAERMQTGMVKALSAKLGLGDGENNEFTSMSLREMARYTLTNRGLAIPRGGAMAMVGAAFVPSMAGGMHGTSDFAIILENIANKAMLKGYNEAPETFERFTKQGSLTDFKPSKRVGIGLFPELDLVKENGEITFGTVGDFGEMIALQTYAKRIGFTRQTIINDDLNALVDMPTKAGRAAKRTIGSLVFAMLKANAAMSDEKALFHQDHGNLASGAAPSETTIDAGINAMAQQKPRGTEDKNARLNVTPRFILAGYAHRAAVLRALNSEHSPDTSGGKGPRAYNTVHKAVEPIFDARLGSEWYLAADPHAFDTIEVAYLDGITEPYIEHQNGWSIDGAEMKVRLDAGVAANAWEGLYKNG